LQAQRLIPEGKSESSWAYSDRKEEKLFHFPEARHPGIRLIEDGRAVEDPMQKPAATA
jgi:hypothetical protein